MTVPLGDAPLPPACPLCHTPLVPGAARCGSCGMLARVGRGSPVLSRASWLGVLAGLAALYAVTLVIVLLAR